MLELRNITKRFGDVLANDHVNITVAPGTIHAIVGENGAGKSTAMRIAYGFYTADDGEILIDGEVLVSAVGALRAANAERVRFSELIAAPAPDKPKQTPATDLLTRSAASFATAPPTPEHRHVWDVDEPEREEEKKPRLEPAPEAAEDEPTPVRTPVMRVVAEPEDDLPEIEWKLPSISLLDTVTARRERMADEIKRNVKIIESTLETFGVECKVVGVNPGPAVTQFEVQPGPGVQVKRITALQNDLSLALAAAPLRIEAPIPGKSAVGIEVPNKAASLVTIREVIETAAFREGTNLLALGLGNDTRTTLIPILFRTVRLALSSKTVAFFFRQTPQNTT